MFDASQYAFFGNDVVEEVELGGLEEEDEILSFNGIGDDLSFVKEEVRSLLVFAYLCSILPYVAFLWFLYTVFLPCIYMQVGDSRLLSDVDDLATTFSKVG